MWVDILRLAEHCSLPSHQPCPGRRAWALAACPAHAAQCSVASSTAATSALHSAREKKSFLSRETAWQWKQVALESCPGQILFLDIPQEKERGVTVDINLLSSLCLASIQIMGCINRKNWTQIKRGHYGMYKELSQTTSGELGMIQRPYFRKDSEQ